MCAGTVLNIAGQSREIQQLFPMQLSIYLFSLLYHADIHSRSSCPALSCIRSRDWADLRKPFDWK